MTLGRMGIAGQSYRSADEDYFRDGKQLGMWLVALAILTPLVQRLILKVCIAAPLSGRRDKG